MWAVRMISICKHLMISLTSFILMILIRFWEGMLFLHSTAYLVALCECLRSVTWTMKYFWVKTDCSGCVRSEFSFLNG
jgi:hypothetical protein